MGSSHSGLANSTVRLDNDFRGDRQHCMYLVYVGCSFFVPNLSLTWSYLTPRFLLHCCLDTGQHRHQQVSVTFFTWLYSDHLKSVGLWGRSPEPRLLVCQIQEAFSFISLPCPGSSVLEFEVVSTPVLSLLLCRADQMLSPSSRGLGHHPC